MEITFTGDGALVMDNEAWGLLCKVGIAGLQEGFYLRALDIFKALLKHRPDEDLAAVGLSLAQRSIGRSADAIATIDQAFARRSTSPMLAVYAVHLRLAEGMAVQPIAIAAAQCAALADPLLAGVLGSVSQLPRHSGSTRAMETQS